MLKAIYVMFLVVLMSSCSSIEKKYETKSELESKLILKLDTIKEDLKNNDKIKLKENLNLSLIQNMMMNEFFNYDLSQIKLSFTDPKFNKFNAENIIALNIKESIVYFDVEYEYLNENWEIIKLKEKG